MMSVFIIAVFVLLPLCEINAQTMITGSDTLKVDYTDPAIKNPKKATILSAIVPGAGQIYNGKPWKVPIIYAGFAANIYFIEFNDRRYKIFRDALFAYDEPGGPTDPNRAFPSLNRDGLVRNVNYWRRNRDLNYFLFIGIYALNIIDANVDAHLSAFDVSDDLTFRFEPSYESLSAGGGNIIGLSLKINFY
ncbi:DUF5683 domain-containing protein [Aquiflexum sp. TKW24L]|uniref:DUF5683 domain-containing protein n=1 Tax=Aquiflexum sp. TKW24L TaxID=2942212 RepID=UPI0020BF2EE4|nr:DUF5683 domain-containing protein [Aquiflexum sp. TKW24L]MCL6260585.1 DUF5683 domain-containing protein [Aquiflexum sp. TKW24L]